MKRMVKKKVKVVKKHSNLPFGIKHFAQQLDLIVVLLTKRTLEEQKAHAILRGSLRTD